MSTDPGYINGKAELRANVDMVTGDASKCIPQVPSSKTTHIQINYSLACLKGGWRDDLMPKTKLNNARANGIVKMAVGHYFPGWSADSPQ